MDIKEPDHISEAPHDLRSIAVDHTPEPCEGARDPTDLAIDVWRGIVVGRWTLIDHFQIFFPTQIFATHGDPSSSFPRQQTGRLRKQERPLIVSEFLFDQRACFL